MKIDNVMITVRGASAVWDIAVEKDGCVGTIQPSEIHEGPTQLHPKVFYDQPSVTPYSRCRTITPATPTWSRGSAASPEALPTTPRAKERHTDRDMYLPGVYLLATSTRLKRDFAYLGYFRFARLRRTRCSRRTLVSGAGP